MHACMHEYTHTHTHTHTHTLAAELQTRSCDLSIKPGNNYVYLHNKALHVPHFVLTLPRHRMILIPSFVYARTEAGRICGFFWWQ